MTEPELFEGVAEEIRFWLRLSTIFYEAFELRRHLGPLYFTISVLASHDLEGKKNTFRLVMRALSKDPVFGTNPKGDLTNYLEHLRELHHIVLRDEKTKPIRRTPEQKYFGASTQIVLTEKFENSSRKFTAGLLEELFGWQSRSKADDLAPEIIKHYYHFVQAKYAPYWNELLRQISEVALPEEGQSVGSLYAEMVGSTEIYLILHIMWSVRLRNEDRDGVGLAGIAERVRRVRPLSDQVVNTYLQLLKINGLLLGDEHYRLSESSFAILEQSVHKLLVMKVAAKEYLEKQVPSLVD
ncbi:MAG TPA: hypothetical protein VGG11_13665 [Xanthobacteraceae bacterium]|jgi:hypothetical protein